MKIHVVSFQVPYPANYGGVIDVYYKLKAMKEAGFEITLHTFTYDGRGRETNLETLCNRVFYYPRQTGWLQQLSLLPYIVKTRDNKALLENLCQDDVPILFEGLHTCYFLDHPRLENRRKIVRMHNIEHQYYSQLAKQSRWNWRILFYIIESWRLKRFERKLAHAQMICAITEADQQELEKQLKGVEIIHLPCFFDTTCHQLTRETKPYVLYHGNLAVEENERVAHYIIHKIAPLCPKVQFVLAGRNPRLGTQLPENINLVPNPTEEEMDKLIQEARIHLMLTFQPTGIKLKLLNALVKGQGHVIANRDMLYGHTLGMLCIQAENPYEIAQQITLLIDNPMDKIQLEKRNAELLKMKKAGISRLSLLNRY